MQKRGLKELADSLTAVLIGLHDLPMYTEIEGRRLDSWTDGVNVQEWLQLSVDAKHSVDRMKGMVQRWAQADGISLQKDGAFDARQEESDGA